MEVLTVVFIKRIDEPDFGCEGVPDNTVITDRVTFVINNEEQILDIPEKVIWSFKLDENMEISAELYNKILELIKL